MNAIIRTRLVGVIAKQIRCAHTSSKDICPINKVNLKNFNPEVYDIPIRVVTMDDCMEPYGSYKTAYQAESSLDGLYMPNLDDIMEIEPIDFGPLEGRRTVR